MRRVVSGWLREWTGMVVVMVMVTLGGGMVLVGMVSLVWRARGTLQRRVTTMSGRRKREGREIKGKKVP